MSRDLRKYANQTNIRLIFGGIFLAIVVGTALIFAFYGPSAAVTGFICFLAALSPIVLIGLALLGLEWIAKRAEMADEEEA